MIANKAKVSGSTIEEVLMFADSNWEAEPYEVLTSSGISLDKYKAILRSDNNGFLGMVGSTYQIVQNSQAFSFMDVLVQEHQAKYQYLYSINNGAKIILQAKIDNNFEVRKNDRIETYLTLINSFNGTTPLMCFFTPVRLWCKNQLQAAIKHKTNCVKIRHTQNIEVKVEEAFRVLGKANSYFVAFKEKSKQLAQKSLNKKMVDSFLNSLFNGKETTRKDNQKQEVLKLTENGKGNNGSSLWDLYNGVTEWVDHSRIQNSEKRLASSLVGTGSTLKEKAWSLANSLI